MLRNITAIIVAFLVINVANASVILNNTRIVIDNAKMEKTYNLPIQGITLFWFKFRHRRMEKTIVHHL